MTRQAGFYGWKLLVVLWLIVVINLSFPLFGGGVIGAYMAADLHFDRSTLGTGFAIFQWMIGLPGPLVAFCLNKTGIRFTMALGTSLVTIGALMMALFVHSGLQVDIVFGVIIGLGAISGGPIAAQSGVGRWFERRKALAISLMITSTGIGGFVAPPLLNRVIELSGGNWRAAWWLVCGLSFLATLLALFFVKEKPSDLGQFPDGELPAPSVNGSLASGSEVRRGVYHTAEEWSFPEAVRSSSMWLMLISLIGFSAGFGMVMSHGVVHLRDLGHTPAQAAYSFSVLSLASLIGALVVAALGDQFEPRNIFAAGSLAGGVGILVLLHAIGLTGLYLYAALVGIGYGCCMACAMTIPANYFGHKAYPTVIGLFVAFGNSSAAVAVYAAGYVYDYFGSYARMFYLIAVFYFGASVLALFMRPPARRGVRTLVAAAGGQTD
jgi:MFS family permease